MTYAAEMEAQRLFGRGIRKSKYIIMYLFHYSGPVTYATKLAKFQRRSVKSSYTFNLGKFDPRSSAQTGRSKEEGKKRVNNAGDSPVTPLKHMARGILLWSYQYALLPGSKFSVFPME